MSAAEENGLQRSGGGPLVELTIGQSRSASLVETLIGTVMGFILSVAVQRTLFPVMGHDFAFAENMLVASVFTVVSILRGYAVRRAFNAIRDQLP